tara:strand:- start:87 stop:218 length:132 start_codon:yes stop_codon:yes gene_type:complete
LKRVIPYLSFFKVVEPSSEDGCTMTPVGFDGTARGGDSTDGRH